MEELPESEGVGKEYRYRQWVKIIEEWARVQGVNVSQAINILYFDMEAAKIYDWVEGDEFADKWLEKNANKYK